MMTGKVIYPSPIISGVPKSANALMNTIREAARIEGIHKGSTTVKNLLNPVQPMFADDSSKELSIFLNAPDTYKNTRGKSFVDNTNRIPLNP